MSDPRREKLPRWAQDEIRLLEIQLRDARAVAAEIADRDADAYTGPYGDFPRPAAKKGEAVRFPFDGIDGRNWIDIRRRGDSLELMASSNLVLLPRVANVMWVALES